MLIDYKNIHDSTLFYADRGYKRIEAPWTVSKYISDITKPNDKVDYRLQHNKKVLVASGEQSFLYLYLKSFLPHGKFQTVTPCFRDELFDLTHTKYFMKNELIMTEDVKYDSMMKMIDDCYNFFSTKLNRTHLEKVKTDEGYDITYMGIEIGSYGIRECEFLKYIYGTGCAEPRLSTCQHIK